MEQIKPKDSLVLKYIIKLRKLKKLKKKMQKKAEEEVQSKNLIKFDIS